MIKLHSLRQILVTLIGCRGIETQWQKPWKVQRDTSSLCDVILDEPYIPPTLSFGKKVWPNQKFFEGEWQTNANEKITQLVKKVKRVLFSLFQSLIQVSLVIRGRYVRSSNLEFADIRSIFVWKIVIWTIFPMWIGKFADKKLANNEGRLYWKQR